MEGSIAEELYSESLRLATKTKLGPASSSKSKQHESNDDDLWQEDSSLCDESDIEPEKSSDLDREWQRRRDQFHTIGYRDGLIAGKEASAQEGFNIGFKQSVSVGYNWGLVRGVTSALACLPDGLKEKLIETQAKRTEFQGLFESVHSISTTDALKLFIDDLVAEASSRPTGLQKQNSYRGSLGEYFGKLQTLVLESSSIKVQLPDK